MPWRLGLPEPIGLSAGFALWRKRSRSFMRAWTMRPSLSSSAMLQSLTRVASEGSTRYPSGRMRLPLVTDDKFHDECGVFGIYGHAEAANLSYLGIHALQHRGQESAGIASWDGKTIHLHKAMGLVADIFTQHAIPGLPPTPPLAHTRYSTPAQPLTAN